MATVKRRIMTRSQILQTMFARGDGKPTANYNYETASHDFAVNMGGMVVIYNDGL